MVGTRRTPKFPSPAPSAHKKNVTETPQKHVTETPERRSARLTRNARSTVRGSIFATPLRPAKKSNSISHTDSESENDGTLQPASQDSYLPPPSQEIIPSSQEPPLSRTSSLVDSNSNFHSETETESESESESEDDENNSKDISEPESEDENNSKDISEPESESEEEDFDFSK